MVEPGAIVFIVFGSVGFAFVCYILVDKLIINQMNRRFNTVAVEPDTEETKEEKNKETKEAETKNKEEEDEKETKEEIRGSNFV